jgi:hypothetical protein
MNKKTEEKEIKDQAKQVETVGDVDQVTEEELQEVDKTLKASEPTEEEKIKQSALVSQTQLRTIQEIEEDLKKPIPQKYIRVLTAGPARGAKYVPWMIVQRILSYYAPGWSTISTGFSTPIGVAIITQLTIPTATGPVTRAGHGFEAHQTTNRQGEIKDTGFGGAAVVASAQAFKRSSVAFGLGRDLYPV